MTSTDQTSEVAAADAAAKVSEVVDQAPNPHATAEQVEAELAEALGVATSLGAGAAVVYATRALDAFAASAEA